MATACPDVVACPPERRTFNPDGSRIREQTAEEKAEEEKRFEEGRKRWGDRVGRRPTPPPPDPSAANAKPSSNSTDDDDDDGKAEHQRKSSLESGLSGATLLPQGKEAGEGGKGGLLRRVFGSKGKAKKEKKPDAYIAAAASWDWDAKGEGDVRRERLGKRGA